MTAIKIKETNAKFTTKKGKALNIESNTVKILSQLWFLHIVCYGRWFLYREKNKNILNLIYFKFWDIVKKIANKYGIEILR